MPQRPNGYVVSVPVDQPSQALDHCVMYEVRSGTLIVRNLGKEATMQREAKVTSKGQVTIPHEIRRMLRIKEGDTVVFEADEHGVRLVPRQPASIFAEYAGIWREGEGLTIDEINAEIRELRGHEA